MPRPGRTWSMGDGGGGSERTFPREGLRVRVLWKRAWNGQALVTEHCQVGCPTPPAERAHLDSAASAHARDSRIATNPRLQRFTQSQVGLGGVC